MFKSSMSSERMNVTLFTDKCSVLFVSFKYSNFPMINDYRGLMFVKDFSILYLGRQL